MTNIEFRYISIPFDYVGKTEEQFVELEMKRCMNTAMQWPSSIPRQTTPPGYSPCVRRPAVKPARIARWIFSSRLPSDLVWPVSSKVAALYIDDLVRRMAHSAGWPLPSLSVGIPSRPTPSPHAGSTFGGLSPCRLVLTLSPSNDRDEQTDVDRTAWAEIGDAVTIQ